MNVILINISAKHDVGSTENELIRMLTDLFDERINGTDKVEKLKKDYGLRVTKEVEREFEALYLEVTRNDGYANVTREEVMKYYKL